jgi:hypothetical protein
MSEYKMISNLLASPGMLLQKIHTNMNYCIIYYQIIQRKKGGHHGDSHMVVDLHLPMKSVSINI